MSKVYLCKGVYAKTPFYVEKQSLNLYSFEEVCYYIKENTCLLDKSIMTPAFIRFLGGECEVEEIERELKTVLHRKKSLSDFCECILRADGNTEVEELEGILENISKSESLDVYEKRKSNADYFVRKKKYFRAMLEYRRLIDETEKKEVVLRSEIIHNMGVIYANMFFYKQAKDFFLEAYEMNGREESLTYYLAAAKMSLDREAYEVLLAEKAIHMELHKEVEGLIEVAESAWQESNLPGTPTNPLYNPEIVTQAERVTGMEQVVNSWKEEYRKFIEE